MRIRAAPGAAWRPPVGGRWQKNLSINSLSEKKTESRYTMRDIALFRVARSPLRRTWAPMRLALTRPASASRLAERAVCPPGAALPARCAAQSREKQWGLLSLGIVQRGGECSTATVQWREGLMGASACAACSPAPCRGMLFVRLAPASQRCPWRRAACRTTSAAMNGSRDASCRAWSERLEARGCRSTPRRMRAVKAARQHSHRGNAIAVTCFQLCLSTSVGYYNRKFGWGVRRSKVATPSERDR